MSHDDHGSHSHDHGVRNAPERALKLALALTGSFMILEAVGGWMTHSLALISDAAHMLTDTAALVIALAAIRIGKRSPDGRRTFGYARFEILAAAFNAVILFIVAMYILWEAIDRFRDPPPIASGAMMGIAVAGLVINLIAMRLLQAGSDKSLNVKGAYLEVWSDMLGSIGVLAAGGIIAWTGWRPIDPIIAVLIGLWVLPRTWTLLKDSINVLLEGVPSGIVVEEIHTRIRAVPGVVDVHHVHVWAVSSDKILLTAHVKRDREAGVEHDIILSSVQTLLREQFRITHATLQIEHEDCDGGQCDLQAPATSGRDHDHDHVH